MDSLQFILDHPHVQFAVRQAQDAGVDPNIIRDLAAAVMLTSLVEARTLSGDGEPNPGFTLDEGEAPAREAAKAQLGNLLKSVTIGRGKGTTYMRTQNPVIELEVCKALEAADVPYEAERCARGAGQETTITVPDAYQKDLARALSFLQN